MGYRSDVRLVVTKRGYEELKRVVGEEAAEHATPDYDYNLLNLTDKVLFNSDGQVMLCWNSVKWYQGSYADVDAVMHGIRHLRDNGYSYSYARIGEALDDIEEDHWEGDDEKDVDYPYIQVYFDDEGCGFEEGDLNPDA